MSAHRTPSADASVRTYDHDVVVVGSGFGGAVTALRAAEKGYDVLVYEAGRRFEDEDFAKTSWNLPRYLWAPYLKCFGVQRLHRLPDVMILAGAGVGGGSLNYANTLYKPPSPFFRDQQWGHITDWESELSPHYDTAKRMLGVVEENPCDGPVERLMKATADDLGVGHTFRKTPVGVFFGEAGRRVEDPYFGGEGPARTGCTECGNCMVGCRVGAKNTLMKNYLALAESKGVEIRAKRTVVEVKPLGDKGFRVTTEESGAWFGKRRETVTAEQVVLAAGTWGTQTLLHRMREEGVLPELSERLGVLTRTNSEALEGAAAVSVPEHMEVSRGVAITTSFHVDDTTHVENCRYGKGSNAMGLLQTLLVKGDEPPAKRAVQFGRDLVRDFAPNIRALVSPRWSERTVIALVMQTLDNSITVSTRRRFGRRVLTSAQGHGDPSPTYIPAGQRAVRALAKRFGEESGRRVVAGGNWAEVFGVPMTAHFLGGAVISESAATGVIDAYHRVWNYPGLHVVDGTAVSANLGVNPSLTITAQAERALSLWPAKGERDERPAQGEPYRRFPAVAARVPGVDLGLPAVRAAG
ncbi:GMC family oxidoreductase [Luteipulveratus sp. YIM 133132]|uniref:GMC family oxidoreductase n=1 Tax=Luteipulveratus flavus TaxID=3031728 RepID=UPI0023AF2A4E|nr:GMC family oxidoreductase [Luteipulveratus sp. YIM 133132]MDE9367163.1 GMC family oxidoreductase [Luteipulveratus sp. YIM 133132]